MPERFSFATGLIKELSLLELEQISYKERRREAERDGDISEVSAALPARGKLGRERRGKRKWG